MRHERATITALLTMAVKCKKSVEYEFTDSIGEILRHRFSCGDIFLVTVFGQMRMREHNAPNESKDEGGGITSVPAYHFIEWEFTSVTFKRYDGVVHIPVDDLRGDFSPFKFVSVMCEGPSSLIRYNPTPVIEFKRAVHLCNAACWYGTACKTDLARTPQEIEAISF